MKAFLWIFCVSVLSVSFGCRKELSHRIAIPEAAIQAALTSALPKTMDHTSDLELPISITFTDATVLLRNGADKLGFVVNSIVNLPEANLPKAPELREPLPPKLPFPKPPGSPPPTKGLDSREILPAKQVHGTVTIFFGLRFEPTSGEFYCTAATLEDLRFQGLPPKMGAPVRAAAEKGLQHILSQRPVYTLSEETRVETLVKSVLKSIYVKDGTLYAELGI